MNPTTLIFDLGDVIINLKKEAAWHQEDLFAHFRHDALQQLFERRFFHDFETGQVSVPEFLHTMQSIAIADNTTEADIRRHWNAILLDMPAHRIALLRTLRQRYRLLLLSNTNDIHLEHIRAHMQSAFGEDVLENTLHTCYYSQRVGLRKPGREIYEWVLQQQQLQGNECVFFDDKPENLVEPARLGIQTVLVDRDISELVTL